MKKGIVIAVNLFGDYPRTMPLRANESRYIYLNIVPIGKILPPSYQK